MKNKKQIMLSVSKLHFYETLKYETYPEVEGENEVSCSSLKMKTLNDFLTRKRVTNEEGGSQI